MSSARDRLSPASYSSKSPCSSASRTRADIPAQSLDLVTPEHELFLKEPKSIAHDLSRVWVVAARHLLGDQLFTRTASIIWAGLPLRRAIV
jgi:hypothetical protein